MRKSEDLEGSGMPYSLGIELGSTSVALSICRDEGESENDNPYLAGADLSAQTWSIATEDLIPAVLHDIPMDAATIGHLSRQYLPRVGDPTGLRAGSGVMPGAQLAAGIVASALAEVEQAEGEAPGQIVLTHPSSWGRFRIESMQQELIGAGLGSVQLRSTAAAAAVGYAQRAGMDVGAKVGMLNVSASGFEAAVVRRADIEQFVVVGMPEARDGAGGARIDDLVMAYALEQSDAIDPPGRDGTAGAASLRQASGLVKESLSTNTEADLTWTTGSHESTLRIVRLEFERLIAPLVNDMTEAMGRAMDAAQVQAADLDAILLIGGAASVPLLTQSLSERFGREIVIDDSPALTGALGAAVSAWFAAANEDDLAAEGDDDFVAAQVQPSQRGAGDSWWRGWNWRRQRLIVPLAAGVAILCTGGFVVASAIAGDGGTGAERPATTSSPSAGPNSLQQQAPLLPLDLSTDGPAAATPTPTATDLGDARDQAAPRIPGTRPSRPSSQPSAAGMDPPTATDDPAAIGSPPGGDSAMDPPATPPVDPTPVDPTPVDPTPVDPTPVDPTPVDPTPVDPTPVDPTPVDPTPVDPTPVQPTDSSAVLPLELM